MLRPILVVLTLLPAPHALAQSIEERARDTACPAPRRAEASARLEQLRAEDEADRASVNAVNADTSIRDRARRTEASAIYSEGCFSTGRDYHNAALIFQHGVVPEHYYQAWLFARRAVELGDSEAQWLVPRAIDRYLMNTGYKQVFATNLVTDQFYLAEGYRGVWCVWPTVDALSDQERVAVRGNALAAQLERATGMNQSNGAPGAVCPLVLPDPPRGMFPGSW